MNSSAARQRGKALVVIMVPVEMRRLKNCAEWGSMKKHRRP
jgi:hypothetical protein